MDGTSRTIVEWRRPVGQEAGADIASSAFSPKPLRCRHGEGMGCPRGFELANVRTDDASSSPLECRRSAFQGWVMVSSRFQ